MNNDFIKKYFNWGTSDSDFANGMSFTAIDFECATPQRDSVCSVGIVTVKQWKIVDAYYSLINPEIDKQDWGYYQMNTHNIKPEMVSPAPRFPEVWDRIEDNLINPCFVVGHNVLSMERHCIEKACWKYGIEPPDLSYKCTQKLASLGYGLDKVKLNECCDHFGYHTLKKNNHHNALADAVASARLILQAWWDHWSLIDDKKYGNGEYKFSYDELLLLNNALKGEQND